MYGVKGTSTILNTVARQGVLTKQLVAPKSTAFLANLPTRQVSAGKLSYTTSRSTQFSQKSINQQQQDQNEIVNSSTTFPISIAAEQHNGWSTVRSKGLKKSSKLKTIEASIEPNQNDYHILEAAKSQNPKQVIDAFVKGKSAAGNTPPELSSQTYEAVLTAYNRVWKTSQPLTPLLNAYQDMVVAGVQPSSQTYALLINSLCARDSEVQKVLSMLKRRTARSGSAVENLGDLENENNLEQAFALFTKAVKEKSTQDFDVHLYNTLLRSLSFKGNTEDGLYIYEHLESAKNVKPDGATFANLMLLFSAAGDIVSVRECFKEYKTLQRRLPRHDYAQVYNALVYAHTNVGDIKGALDILENVMVKDRIKVSVLPYNKIVRRVCYDNNIEAAESLLAKLETDVSLPKPNASTYGILLSTHCRLANTEKAGEVYKKMLDHDVSKQYGHIANYASYFTENNMPDEAFNVVKDMTSRGLELDAAMCEKVIMSYVNSDRLNDAVTAFKSVVELHAKSNFINEKSPVVNLALDLTLKCKDINSAISILQTMQAYSVHAPSNVYEHVLHMYQEAKANPDQWKKVSSELNDVQFGTLYDGVFRSKTGSQKFCEMAFDLLKDMHSLNLQPTTSIYIRVLARMRKYEDTVSAERWKQELAPVMNAIEDQIKLEQKAEEKVESATDSIKTDGEKTHVPTISVESDMLTCTALQSCVGGDFEKACDILKNQIVSHGKIPTPEGVRDMIQLSSKAGRLDAAQNIYKIIADSLDRLENSRKHRAFSMIYNPMLVAYARSGNLEEAKTFYDKLRAVDLYPDADAYGALLANSTNSTTDESTEALAIYEEVKKHNVRPTVYFYNVVISKLAKCRKIEAVLHLFDEMKQSNVAPNTITYASIISACLRCSSEGRAARYFQEMITSPKYVARIGAYNNMMQFYVQQKPNREKALEYYNLSKQHNVRPSQHTYKLLMEAYANIPAYDMLTAHKLLTEMSKRHNLRPTPGHYATLIRSYGCLHRDVQSALAVYKEMKKVGIEADETVYQAMLNTYIENNDMHSAEQLYKDMLSQGTKSSPYIENLFITGYGAQGQLEKAEHVFTTMSSHGLMKEPSTYESMAKAYLSNGQKDKVNNVVEQMRARDFPSKVVDSVAQMMHTST